MAYITTTNENAYTGTQKTSGCFLLVTYFDICYVNGRRLLLVRIVDGDKPILKADNDALTFQDVACGRAFLFKYLHPFLEARRVFTAEVYLHLECGNHPILRGDRFTHVPFAARPHAANHAAHARKRRNEIGNERQQEFHYVGSLFSGSKIPRASSIATSRLLVCAISLTICTEVVRASTIAFS